MKKIKRGDIVGRISYNKDVLFIVQRIINEEFVILKGITVRIEADAPIKDLELINPRDAIDSIRYLDYNLTTRLEKHKNKEDIKLRHKRKIKLEKTGKILHLDGDKKYSEKSLKYYSGLGLNAIVRNIAENKQQMVVRQLVEKYQPDILVITGHDGMIKRKTDYQNIYNYRNSRHFVKTVQEARKAKTQTKNELVIFAGACQSFYEAIISAGANFASSPARILIDFIDPLIVAEKIALTDENRFLAIRDIEDELRDGQRGISGIGAMGKKKHE